MSYYNDYTLCPKCGQESSSADICDSCGALISKIREREIQSSDAERDDSFGTSEERPLVEIGQRGERMSLTAITLVIVMAAGIGGFIYFKQQKGIEDAADPSASTAVVQAQSPDSNIAAPAATPIYNFASTEPKEKPEPTASTSTAPTPALDSSEKDSAGVFGAITEAFKARAENASANTGPNSPQSVPAAQPATNSGTTPAQTASVAPPASAPPLSSAQSTSDPNAPITIEEGDITSSNFGIKASSVTPKVVNSPASSAPAAAGSGLGKRSVVSVDSSSFAREVLAHRGEPVLVDFYATWCGPCKRLAPQLEVFAAMNDKLKVVKLDVDQSKAIAMKYKIRSMPTLVLFKDGKELGRNSGLPSMAQLQASVKPHL